MVTEFLTERAARLRALRPQLTELPPTDPVTLRGALEHQLAACIAAGKPAEGAPELLALAHYYPSWEDVLAHGEELIDRDFERAADAIVDGDLATLQQLLATRPELARARSTYGHHQTLLQHVAANGIEITRQWQSPANACELARVLLAAGAEPDAPCDSYGGDETALTLVCSSAHPALAGVQADLAKTLCDGGARIDGPTGDSAPLWTAAVWGYGAAVDRLVACGARLDNLVLAAASGDLERVRGYFASDGSLPPQPALQMGTRGKQLPAEHILEYALIYAASLDRRDVVAFLLTKKPDLTVSEPVYNATALDVAQYPHLAAGRPAGNPAIVALLQPQ
jgi:hypothetical protein